MKNNWENKIIKNFNNVFLEYDKYAFLQRKYAITLARICSKLEIPNGNWIDLGTGTGMLANELEKLNPEEIVLRVDVCRNMLKKHPKNSMTILHNLNKGLPKFKYAPSLICSNFCLHWLNKPLDRLDEWIDALSPKGFLAITLPIEGSFPEWKAACTDAGVTYTGNPFPIYENILNISYKNNLIFEKISTYKYKSSKVTSLMRLLTKTGANATVKNPITISEWKRLQSSWPKDSGKINNELSWKILQMVIQK